MFSTEFNICYQGLTCGETLKQNLVLMVRMRGDSFLRLSIFTYLDPSGNAVLLGNLIEITC